MILVTGGAGYVGSVVVERLLREGVDVVVVDNLQQGHRQAVLPPARFVAGDVRQQADLDTVFGRFPIEAVMHFAADSIVSQSMTDPHAFFQNNVGGGLAVLGAMLRHDVKRMVFSSSAAVYGEPRSVPIEEDHPRAPLNPYGETKLVFETVLAWYGRAYGMQHISLRYFNAAGASERLGEDHHPETHLIPNVLRAARDGGSPLAIFGGDYPTRDGSCVRDYVHVEDIAEAHVRALEKIGELTGRAYNLGHGQGYSVLEVVKTAEEVCGTRIPVVLSPRRAGDPATLLASSSKARAELNWAPGRSDLRQIVESAWAWLRAHPDGYSGQAARP